MMENMSSSITAAPTTSCLPSTASDGGGTSYTGLHGLRLVVHAAVMLLGLPGNSLILCVYWTKRLKSSTHVLIMSLAWADLTVCLLKVLDITAEAYLLAGQRYPAVIHILLPLENTAVGATMMITTFIAADRYDCVCRPQRRFFTTRRAKKAAVGSTVLSLVINAPAFILVSTGTESLLLRILVYSTQIASYVVLLVTIALCYRRVYLTIRNHARVNGVRPGRPRQPYGAPKPSESNDWMTDDKGIWIPTSKPLPSSNPPSVHRGVQEQFNPRGELPKERVPARKNHKTEQDSNRNRIKLVGYDNELTSTTKSSPEFGPRIINVNEAFEMVPEGCALPGSSTGETSLSQSDKMVTPKGTAGEPSTSGCRVLPRLPPNKVGTSMRSSKKYDGSSLLQRKTTRMLFITSLVFLLSWLPYWIYVIGLLVQYGGASVNESFQHIIEELHIIIFLNDVVNPLIYGIWNARFRKDCREVFRKAKIC